MTEPHRRTAVNAWDHALDHFEASVAALSAAMTSGEWGGVRIEPVAIDVPTVLTSGQRARLERLDGQWRQLEPMLLDALAALDDEIASLAASRRGRTEYARHSS